MDDILVEKINEIIDRGNCFSWLGAGLSNRNYPKWDELIKELCRECHVEYSKSVKPEVLAESCKKNNKIVYNQKMRAIFKKKCFTYRRACSNLLHLPFCGHITTNYEVSFITPTTEVQFEIYRYPYLPLKTLEIKNIPIYFVHGLIQDDGSDEENQMFVLASSEYEYAYSGVVGDFLRNIFTFRDVIFIGSSLNESKVMKVIETSNNYIDDILKIVPHFKKPKRLMLLTEARIIDDSEKYKSECLKNELKKLGIDVNVIEVASEECSEIDEIFENICNKRTIFKKPAYNPSNLEDLKNE